MKKRLSLIASLSALASTSLLAQPDETAMSMITTHETPALAFEEVIDQAGFTFKNPDLAGRKTAKLRLSNGLEAFLISDPKADQSSASIAVQAGSWNDPEEYPGMAHFCEHMLFLGTGKYPDSNEFAKVVSDQGGVHNAFTAPDRTVYMFSSKAEGFLSILDRFARFFIDPLFDQRHIARELHAVDQEHSKNLENDNWRQYMIFKEMSNTGHPNQKFSTGNSETLGHIPSSALREWHQAHYSATNMHLFIYSSLPLETLKQQAVACFAAVPVSESDTALPYAPILSAQQKGHITYIKPIQNRQTLTLTWELPPELSNDSSKSAELIAYALNRGQVYSLYERLKEEQLIDDLLITADDLGAKVNGSLGIIAELTPKGIAAYRDVIQRCFEAIASLKKSGIPSYLHEERNEVAVLSYEYQSRQDAFQAAMNIGRTLPDEPLSTFPREQIVAAAYSPETIQAVFALLTPEQCAISLAASPALTHVEPDKTEKWFQAEYAVASVPQDWLAAWNSVEPHPNIRVPAANPFVPKQLNAVAAETSEPILLTETENGTAYYARVPEFSAPEASIHLSIRSPELQATAKSSVLLSLYIDHLTDDLHPTLSAAQAAGLSAKFDFDKLKFRLQVYGFSDKAPLLLNEILKGMASQSPTEEQFAIYKARHAKAFSNGSRELPLRQAKELLDSLLLNDRFTHSEKLAALEGIEYPEFLAFCSNLFNRTYAEGLFAGNLTVQQAESSWLDVQHILSQGTYSLTQHTRPKVLELSEDGGPYAVEKATEAQGNGALLAIDAGAFNLEKRSVQDILTPPLKDAFFNELRTKQKTAYIAASDSAELEDRLFQFFLVQSNSHHPQDLLYRFELFLEEYVHTLAQHISQERFETLKGAAMHSLKTRYRNLRDKAALLNLLAFEKGGDFEYVAKRIEALEALHYDRFQEIASDILARSNTKRLAVLYEGRQQRPFVYESVDASHLPKIGRYVAKEDRKERVQE